MLLLLLVLLLLAIVTVVLAVALRFDVDIVYSLTKSFDARVSTTTTAATTAPKTIRCRYHRVKI